MVDDSLKTKTVNICEAKCFCPVDMSVVLSFSSSETTIRSLNTHPDRSCKLRAVVTKPVRGAMLKKPASFPEEIENAKVAEMSLSYTCKIKEKRG